MGIEDRRQDRTIDGVTYSVVPLGSAVGIKALDRFKNVALPLISGALSASSGIEDAVAQALKTVPTALSSADVEYFQKTFGDTSVYLDGDKRVPLTVPIQDLHFSGRYMALFDWLTFCMEVNFAGFFGELRTRASGAMSQAKVKAATASPSTIATGLSAES